MKKLFTFFALALFSAIGLVGGSVAQAAVWSINFSEVGSANKLSDKYQATISAAVSDGMGTVTLGSALDEHFGIQTGTTWLYRTADKALYSMNKGNRNFGVFNAKSGQTITLNTSVAPATVTNATLETTEGNIRTYTVTNDGTVIFNIERYSYIYSIAVEGEVAGCDNPTFKIVGAMNEGRRINLACDTEGSEIYYSETELASAAGGSKYEGTITTSAAKLWIYAKTADATSEVVTIETGAGTTVQLNAPSYYIASMQPKGSYVAPEYGFSSNQSDVIGTPSVSYFYQIDGGEVKAGSSYVPTAKCSLTIIARSEGYAENSTTIDINAYLLKKIKDYDFTAFKEHSDETVGDLQLINGKGCQAYALAKDVIENVTLDNISLMWAISANKALGLYARVNTGTVTYNGAFPEGSVILYKDINDASYFSNSNVLTFAQYGSVKSMEVYNALTDEELEDWEKIQNSFIPVDGPTYDPDKAPEGGIESATRPEHGMATSPSDTTQSDNTNGTATGINGAEAEAQIVSIVNVNGAKVNSLQKGINIVTYSNGKRVKVLK